MTELVQYFKVLSDENRIMIIKRLKPGNVCACELLEDLQVTQPTLSHHMKVLVESGLVDFKKDGKWVRYSLNEEKASYLIEKIQHIF